MRVQHAESAGGNWMFCFVDGMRAAMSHQQYHEFLSLMAHARRHQDFVGSEADDAALEAARRVLPESVTERSEFLGLLAERAPAGSKVRRWASEVLEEV